MESSKNALERILTAVETLDRLAANASGELTEEEKAALEEMKQFRTKFEEAMDDDLNTADAVSAIFELVKFANTKADENSSKAFTEALKKEIAELCDILGLKTEKKEENLDAEVEALIEQRQAARKAKDFAKADEIRDKLLDMGIQLKDTREGVQWKRI